MSQKSSKQDNSGINRKLFINTSWLFGGRTLSGIFAAVQAIILARMLGVSDYGLLAIIIAYVDVINNIFDFRVWETATKYVGTYWAKGEREKTRAMIKLSYIIDTCTGIVALSITLLTAGIASAYLIESTDARYLIFIYAFSLLIGTANSTSDAILRVFDRFRNIAYISSFANFIRLVFVIAVLLAGFGITGVLFAFIFSSFLGFAVRIWIVLRTLNTKGLEKFWKGDLGLIKSQRREIAWFLGNTGMAGTIKMTGDNYLGILTLGYFSGNEAAAYYRIAKAFVKIMTRITDPLYESIYPELVRMSGLRAIKDFKNLLRYATRTLVKFTLPLAALIFIFADTIINIVYGQEYLPATNTMRVIVLAVATAQINFWVNPVLLALGRPGLRTMLGIIAGTVYISLLYLLVPEYSHTGAAFAFLGYTVVNLIISLISLKFSISREKKLIDKYNSTLTSDSK